MKTETELKFRTNEIWNGKVLKVRARTHCLRSDRLCCLQVRRRGAGGVLVCRRHLGLSGGIWLPKVFLRNLVTYEVLWLNN
jgi:hypothetical protein